MLSAPSPALMKWSVTRPLSRYAVASRTQTRPGAPPDSTLPSNEDSPTQSAYDRLRTPSASTKTPTAKPPSGSGAPQYQHDSPASTSVSPQFTPVQFDTKAIVRTPYAVFPCRRKPPRPAQSATYRASRISPE